ncbi:MAG: histidine kinase, partial [Nonomuraea sp.]|nr:histidine kinase [Nonomuraea sp.]
MPLRSGDVDVGIIVLGPAAAAGQGHGPHDGALQHIVGARMRLRSLQRRLPDDTHAELDAVVETLEGAIAELRSSRSPNARSRPTCAPSSTSSAWPRTSTATAACWSSSPT